VRPLQVERDVKGLRGAVQARKDILEFNSALVGAANLQNILGAIGVASALKLDPRAIAEGINKLGSVPGRLERVPNRLGITVLVDYAHTPDALEKVLGAVRSLTGGKLVTVFGCGGDRDRGKRPLMGEIAGRLSDVTVLTSDNPRTESPIAILEEIEAGIRRTEAVKLEVSTLQSQEAESRKSISQNKRGYFVEANRRTAIGIALSIARPDDLVLIAGKGHEDYQILGTEKIHFDDREVAREEAEAGAAV
jgi:UDP-N-acetylmuramoyl-L-alanyl-D-glutamate--2,6-diaminopimelate ligase